MPFFDRRTSEREAEPTGGLGSGPRSGEKGPMARGKNTHPGLGDKSPNRSTRMGLKVQNKKIVTKRGLVAPSPEDPARLQEFVPESDRKGRESEIVRRDAQQDAPASEVVSVYEKTTDPFGLAPPPPLDQMQVEHAGNVQRSEADRDSTRELETDPVGSEPPIPYDDRVIDSARIAAHEDVTPREGSDLDDPDARHRFRTAPGGGKNRISGGREHAKAYVSPTTLRPSTPVPPITSAVKVLDVVENAVRAYRTEPSLLRRRASSLPPRFPSDQPRTHLLVGGVAIGIVLAAMALWGVLRTQQQPTAGPPSNEPDSPAAPHQEVVAPQKTKISRNESETGPKTEQEGEIAAPPPKAAKKEPEPAPSSSKETAARPPDPPTSPVHEEATVAKPPRSEAQAPVKKAVSSEAKEPPPKPASSAPATKTSSQDLWLE